MQNNKLYHLIFILCLLNSNAFGGDETLEKVYSFGVVPQFDPNQQAKIWIPILAEVEKLAGLRFKLLSSPSIPDFEVEFNFGRFDFAYMNAYQALIANKKQKYLPFLRDQGKKLQGILVTKKSSAITNINQLKGMTIAFPSPSALGASLIIRSDFQKNKIKINPLYVKSHTSVYLNILLGKAVAGGGVIKTLKSQSQEIQRGLKVIYQTRKFPSHPLVFHPRVSKSVLNKVKAAFQKISETKEGKLFLSKVPINNLTSASLKDFTSLKDLKLNELQ